MTSRGLSVSRFRIAIAGAAVVLVVLVAFFAVLARQGYVGEFSDRVTEQGPAASLTDLNDVAQFGAAFDRQVGTPRLVLLFSPT
jgi:hypothetical protein